MAEADNEADNIALYRRLIDDGVGVGNLAVVEEVLAPDIAMPTLAPMAPPDLEGLEQVQVALRAGMPDTKVTIDDLVANGDWVAASSRGPARRPASSLALHPPASASRSPRSRSSDAKTAASSSAGMSSTSVR